MIILRRILLLTSMFILIPLVFQELIQRSWDNYYQNIEQPKESNTYSDLTFNSNNGTLQPTTGNSYIFNCYFYDMHTTSGGAILYSFTGSNLLVEKCTINNCKATTDTAGIRVSAGNCILAFVCSQYGYAGNNDGFCSIHADSSRTINSVSDSSVSHCETNKWHTMYHYAGNVYIKSLNLSRNKASERSPLSCEPNKINEEANHASDVLFCSFSNNTAKSQHCIYLYNFSYASCTHEIKNCNIIENKAKNTIWCRGSTDIISSCILNNGDPCFYSSSNSKITLYFCSVDNMKQSDSNFVTSHGSTTSFIHGLTFIITGDCVNIFDTIGSLTPSNLPTTKPSSYSSFFHRKIKPDIIF